MQSYILHPRGTVFYHLINYLSSKFCPIDMLREILEIIENMTFSLILVLGKYDISVNGGKSRKYDIYVECFYENVVFHAVTKIAKSKIPSILSAQLILGQL